MRRILAALLILTLGFSFSDARPRPWPKPDSDRKMPLKWRWDSEKDVTFTYDGSFRDSSGFTVSAPHWSVKEDLRTPTDTSAVRVADSTKLRIDSLLIALEKSSAENPTLSPDSSMVAYTRGGNLYVREISGVERAITTDGGGNILNGYASWVYYEEIFGRPSKYRAFWWSPDSRSIAFYRFDESAVPMFPIYSPFGQDGNLRETRYPKAGEHNPEVSIGISDMESGALVWADFDSSEDQYFGTPFWGADSRRLFVSREPRIQNALELYAVSRVDGGKKCIYKEKVSTWLDWIGGMLFSEKGLYMVRSFETGWEQIYFLSYDGNTLRRLTDGPNWNISLIRLGEDGTVYFSAERDSHVRRALYKVSPRGSVTALTDTSLDLMRVEFSPDGRYFTALLSSLSTPTQLWVRNARNPYKAFHVASLPDVDRKENSISEIVHIAVDGLEIPAKIMLPLNFNPSLQYPVHVDIYGGPNTPLVRDRWVVPNERNQWYAQNGIIQVVADCRAAGHNGRAGLDAVYKHLNRIEVSDFIAWAEYLKTLPYVNDDKIGVEGFSFGGTMTAMLLLTASDSYHYGIAGGGVYDWMLYDTHYAERFMSTPEDNPEGYKTSRVIEYASSYPVDYKNDDGSVMLRLTHGTGDDNVHFQNTLQLVDALQKEGRKFELMIYPDGMHGYRGYQGKHSLEADREFWLKHLCGK